jgi:hypothetical protein
MERMTSASFNAIPITSRLGGRTALNAREYQRLLRRALPRVSRTEAENERYLELLAQLDARSADLTPHHIRKFSQCFHLSPELFL